MHSPEDILLQKLRWFRLGGERPERQWRDVLAIVHVQGNRLDRAYLLRGADLLGVADLLGRGRLRDDSRSFPGDRAGTRVRAAALTVRWNRRSPAWWEVPGTGGSREGR